MNILLILLGLWSVFGVIAWVVLGQYPDHVYGFSAKQTNLVIFLCGPFVWIVWIVWLCMIIWYALAD
jgi:hypothetical protein